MSDSTNRIDALVKANDVVLFMKGTVLFPQCGFSSRAVAILERLGQTFETVDVLQDPELRQASRSIATGRRSHSFTCAAISSADPTS